MSDTVGKPVTCTKCGARLTRDAAGWMHIPSPGINTRHKPRPSIPSTPSKPWTHYGSKR